MMGGNQNECRVSWPYDPACNCSGPARQLGGLGHLPAVVAYRVGPTISPSSAEAS
jgi:hypothetical protein